MKRDWKYKVAKMTGSYRQMNKKALQMKRSWDEVGGILDASMKKKKGGK